MDETAGALTPESAAAIQGMIQRLRTTEDVRAAALQTIDILELALPAAEVWAMAEEGLMDDQAHPLDWFDSYDPEFVDEMRLNKLAPC
jgi:hypothetical protein